MLGSYLLPARLRGSDETGVSAKPKWLNRRITPVLLALSRRACIHPIYTLVFVAIMASTTYLGLLESSLFDRQLSVSHAPGRVDFDTLLQGSKNLFVGEESAWKWISADADSDREVDEVSPKTVQLKSRILTFLAAPRPRHLRLSGLHVELTQDRADTFSDSNSSKCFRERSAMFKQPSFPNFSRFDYCVLPPLLQGPFLPSRISGDPSVRRYITIKISR